MATLRITQFSDSQPDRYRVEVALEGNGLRQTATARFQFKLTQQEQENIRWYLEDYLQYLSDPAPQIAAKVESWMAEIGVELFKAIFQANDDTRDLWATLRQNLNQTRVEILTDVAQATAIPWELLRDPKTDTCLALRSPTFVRSYSQPAQRPRLPQTDGDTIRILLVICRPHRRQDVPFRSVASRLIKKLSTRPDGFQLDVLRPPTFKQLGQVLRQARAQGRPYHVVHFDGHGVYQNSREVTLNANPLLFADRRPGMHGYLAFENSKSDENVEFVSGSDLGQLLVETDVPVLVLNACRSAHAELLDSPTQMDESSEQTDNPHSQVRSFGSLAQEVMDAGVAGVVAMRYNVYVMTAAQFVADLYTSLVQGQTLGEAVTFGRKQLRDQPLREIAYQNVALQDWLVPVVYETSPLALFPAPIYSQPLTITLHENDSLPTTGMLDAQLPRTPDVGFFGRDETLLAIDRAFDNHSIVLLHAFAGSGKTSTAAEFSRWYALTGGLLEAGRQGFVLFTSFQRYLPLSRVLDKLGQVFERDLERSGIHWLALSDDQRRAVALQVLSQVPVLWIWDNVEPIAGFPDGETQRWSEAEQQELADFLRDARDTKAKFLLTSRRDERAWLGDLPVRVEVPPMPMRERVQFARALAEKHGYRLTDVRNWLPLLKHTQGNPLTITVVVGQALRNGYRSKEQIEKFISDLQSGEAELDDDECEGRSKSLSASLGYGFSHAFSETDLKRLALLHLFQDFVNVKVLCEMGAHPEENWHLPILTDVTLKETIDLLNKAAEIGLLDSLGDGAFIIHPALPWYFKKLFENYLDFNDSICKLAYRAFAEVMGLLGDVYSQHYICGKREVIYGLIFEEANLLYACNLSRCSGSWRSVIGTMNGLRALYTHTDRFSEWKRLVDESLIYFINLSTDEPLLGREEEWGFINDYRVRILYSLKKWAEAERLQRIKVNWSRSRISPEKIQGNVDIDSKEFYEVRRLAVDLQELGNLLREQGNKDCLELYMEAMTLCKLIRDKSQEVVITFNIGAAYMDLSKIYDLEQAQYWYERNLELLDENDYFGKSSVLSQLGQIAFKRFEQARLTNDVLDVQLSHWNDAKYAYSLALELMPSEAIGELAIVHNALGVIWGSAREYNRALEHCREATYYAETSENLYVAAQACSNIALFLGLLGHNDEALIYAQSALQKFKLYEQGPRSDIENVRNLIGALSKP